MDFKLTPEEKQRLLRIARDAIEGYARSGEGCARSGEGCARSGQAPATAEDFSGALASRAGAFVSLHKGGQLRGCIGTFMGDGPLAQTVRGLAVSAGWQDNRFPPLSAEELQDVDLEISVLSPLTEVLDVAEIEVGRHGIYITKGAYRGVLLPQVAVEYGWDRETFLSQTCQKAGLPADAWRREQLKIEVFTAEIFGEKDRD